VNGDCLNAHDRLAGTRGPEAKIDTGARTSALHAEDIVEFERKGRAWVRFHSRFDDDTSGRGGSVPDP
jgi:hypothetical protein